MKLDMISSKHGVAVSYLITGSTSASGAAVIAQQQAQVVASHTIFGFPLSEVALIVGIIGTFVTMTLQYLNYRNNKNK